MENLPATYKAVVLPDYNPNVIRAMLTIKIEEKTIPELQDDQVLIKTEAAPINPSDIAFMQGGYNIKKTTPCVPGFEGTGVVVKTGNDAAARGLAGKKVSCFTQHDDDGTWADYFVTRAQDCIPLDDNMPIEQAACFAINPLTAYGLYETARLNKSRTIIQNAAGSQVCNYIRKMAAMSDMEVINIVRKKETAANLKSGGSKHVLHSDEEGFTEKLRDLTHLLNATTAFDAVGGDMSGILYNAMPAGGKVIVYGGLSGKTIGNIDVLHAIFKNKSLGGFNLNDWLATKTQEHFRQIAREVQDMFIRQELKTEIQASFKFEEIKEGLKQYLGNMSGGKILLTP